MFASSIAYPVTYVKTNTWFYEILIIWWEIWIPLSDCCSGINFSLTEPCGVWGSHQYSYWCCFDFLTCKVSAVLSVWLDTLVYSCLISTLVTKIEGYILDDFCGHSFWCSKRNRVSPTCITDLITVLFLSPEIALSWFTAGNRGKRLYLFTFLSNDFSCGCVAESCNEFAAKHTCVKWLWNS